MHLIHAIVTTSVGCMAFIFFREKPEIPVSPTSLMPRIHFFPTLKSLLSDRNYIFMALFTSISEALVVSYRVIMRDAFKNYGITAYSIGMFSLISTPFTIASILLSGYISHNPKNMKTLFVVFGLFEAILLMVLIFLLNIDSAILFGVIQILL